MDGFGQCRLCGSLLDPNSTTEKSAVPLTPRMRSRRLGWFETRRPRYHHRTPKTHGSNPDRLIFSLPLLSKNAARLWNLIDPTLLENVLIPEGFFKYIYHIGCAINLHSITNSGLIPGGQNLSNRQTVFFTAVNPVNKEHKDLDTIDWGAPRLAWYKQKKWRRHQNTLYWVDVQLAQQKGLEFYQTRSNAIILYDTLAAYCIPKGNRMESGEIIYEKVCASPRPPPKISFKDNWIWRY